MHAQLEKHWKLLCHVTDLSLRVNSGKHTTKPRASRDFLFSVSTVSRDVKCCSHSHSRYEKLGALVHFLNSLQMHMKLLFV